MGLTLKEVFFFENKNKNVWYHGTKNDIKNFSIDFTGKGNDQEGPGIYFTSSKEEAKHYGKNVKSIKINPRNLVPKAGQVSEKTILHLMRNAPNYKMSLTDWDENPKQAEQALLSNIMNFNGNPQEVFKTIWGELYINHPIAYLKEMIKLGYDGHIVEQQTGNKHLIVYNPKIIKTNLSEATAEKDEDFRNIAEEAYGKVKEFLGGPYAVDKHLEYDVGYLLTPDDLEWHHNYPDLYVFFVPADAPFKGKFVKKQDKYYIILSILNETKELEQVAKKLPSYSETFVHEFIHYLDIKRRKNKNNYKGTQHKRQHGIKAYINSPEETNAFFQQTAHKIANYFEMLEKHRPDLIEKFLIDFEQFLKKSKSMFPKGFFEALEEKNEKKILNRLYGFYEHLRKKYYII